MLRFVDGFDLCSGSRARLKYNRYSASLDQTTKLTGRAGSGQAFVLLNNAFGEANYMLGFSSPAAVWCFHVDLQVQRLGTGAGFHQVDFFWWRASSVTQLALRVTTAGRLALVNGLTGIVIATSAAALSLDTWYTLEVRVANGGGGAAVVLVNGATFVSGAGFGSGASIDELGFRWQTFGPPSLVLDNFVVYDGTAGDLLTWPTGRLQVDTLRPVSDVVLAWAPVPGPAGYAMLDEVSTDPAGSPDLDTTYIRPASAADQLFTVESAPCFGKIYGLALNACLRPAGSIYAVRLLCQPGATKRTLGAVTPTSANYATLQAVATENPDGGDWTAAAISGAYWGVGTDASAQTRVTALYIEQITSLVPQPYDCGGGPYSF